MKKRIKKIKSSHLQAQKFLTAALATGNRRSSDVTRARDTRTRRVDHIENGDGSLRVATVIIVRTIFSRYHASVRIAAD